MTNGVISIAQTNNLEKFEFEVWIRQFHQVPYEDDGSTYVDHKFTKLTSATEIIDPAKWSVPAEKYYTLLQKLKWYLEDYFFQTDSGNDIDANYLMRALVDWGVDTYKKLFQADDIHDFFKQLFDSGVNENTWIEIISSDSYVLSWPWEALISPEGNQLAVHTAFERRYVADYKIEEEEEQTVVTPKLLSVLLVTARQQNDIDYRLVGKNLLAADSNLKVTLVNPPTLANLKLMLETSSGFDILHFDCHGDIIQTNTGEMEAVLYLENKHMQLIPIPTSEILNNLTHNTPRIVVLNSCRSAMSSNNEDVAISSIATTLLNHYRVHTVLAMAYKLSVDAVYAFFSPFYSSMRSGQRISVAAYLARLSMMNILNRKIPNTTTWVADWIIPVVYTKAVNITVRNDMNIGEPYFIVHEDKSDSDNMFVGRDNLFYFYDRSISAGYKSFLLTGMVGAGKTAFAKELIWWRNKISSAAQDFFWKIEKNDSLNLFLNRIKTDYVTYEVNDDVEFLKNELIKTLSENNYWIVIDDFQNLHFSENKAEFIIFFQSLLRQINFTKNSYVLFLSRSHEDWLNEEYIDIKTRLTGFTQVESFYFSEHLHKPMSNAGELKDLLFYIAGNPSTLKLCLTAVSKGIPPLKVLFLLKNNFPKLCQYSDTKIDLEKFNEASSVLQEDSIRIIMPILLLFEEHAHEKRIKEIYEKYYGSLDSDNVKKAYDLLELNGLVLLRAFMHPVLKGIVKAFNPILADDKLKKIFLGNVCNLIQETDKDSVVDEDSVADKDKEYNTIMLGTLKNAFNIAVKFEMFPEMVLVSKYIKHLYQSKNEIQLYLEFSSSLRDLFTSQKKYSQVFEEIGDAIFACRTTREQNQVTSLINTAEKLYEKQLLHISANAYAYYLYQSAMVYIETAQEKKYKTLLDKLKELLPQINEQDLRLLILVELGNNEPKTSNSIDDEIDSILQNGKTIPNYKGNILRTRAETKVEEKKYDEAQRYLTASNLIARRQKDDLLRAMNLSLSGTIKGRQGDILNAKKLFDDAIKLFQQMKDDNNTAIVYHQLGLIHFERNEIEQAAEAWIHAAKLMKKKNNNDLFSFIARNYQILIEKCIPEGRIYFQSIWTSSGLSN